MPALTASQEDYLEAIGDLVEETGAARVRDIARRLNVAMPSVTSALQGLGRRKLVHYTPYELVTLTARGAEEAARIRRRHRALRFFLMEVLDVAEPLAEENACRIEHAVSDEVMSRLQAFVEFTAQSRVPACKLAEAFRKQYRPAKHRPQAAGQRKQTKRPAKGDAR